MTKGADKQGVDAVYHGWRDRQQRNMRAVAGNDLYRWIAVCLVSGAIEFLPEVLNRRDGPTIIIRDFRLFAMKIIGLVLTAWILLATAATGASKTAPVHSH